MAGKRRIEISTRRRWALRVLIFAVILAVLASLTGVYLKQRFEGNIKTETFIPETVTGVARPDPLPEVKGALNILVMGSDTRAGGNGKGIGGDTPGLSDTTILLHLAENRRFAYGVSIPRDAMVDRPACPRKSGEGVDEGGFSQFNEAYAIGGPACTVATVEQLTNVRINHFAVVDFSGFRTMIDAVGGVRMCVPEPVNDDIGKIYLKAGTYNMDGDTALDYVRVRHGIGVELGDIGRMKRQQAFLAAMVSKITSSGVLANPVKVLKLLEASTESLTTDEEFANLRKLGGLATSMKDIGMDKVRFVTAPFEPWPTDPNRVILTPDADAVWTKMRRDEPLPRRLVSQVITPEEQSKNKNVEEQDASSDINRSQYGLC